MKLMSYNIDWATFKNIQWTNGTFANGFKEASNTGFSGYGIRAAIVGGFLIVQVGVSKTDGAGFGTEVIVGYIPNTINGIQVNNIAVGANHRNIRGYASGSGGVSGSIQLDGNSIAVITYDNTNKWAWVFGEIIIPLNN